MASVKLAWQQDADVVEVDIHLSKDKEIVVVHDRNAKRTGGLNKNINELNLHELKQLDFGSWKGAEWSGEKIPLLRDVLESVPQGKRLFVEVKCGPEIIGPLAILLNQNIVPLSNIVIMHFDLNTLLKIKDNFPENEILFLYEFLPFSIGYLRKKLMNGAVNKARENNFHGINIENIPEYDIEFINTCRANKLKTYCWVVNDPARAKYLIDSGIDGITTDRPGWLKKQLNKLSD
jgi:glycerophosphoryl diester phosphodiesterase